MKPNSNITIVTATLLIAMTGLTAESTKQPSTTSLADLKTHLQKLAAQVDLTVGALESLKGSTKKSTDFKNDLQVFSESYASLEKQLESARTQAITMKARAKEHYESWEKELEGVQNPKLRAKAADRLAEARGQFVKIIERGEDLRRVSTPFLADLKDIKTFLDIDPSEKAVSSLSNSIWKLGNESKTVIKRLDAVVQQIDKTLGVTPAK